MKHTATIHYTINASKEKVWQWLTQPELLKQYFFGTQLVTTWEVNTPIFFRGAWEGNAYEDKGMVLRFEPFEGFEYTYLSSWSNLEDKPEHYQTIKFELEDKAESTQITITQSEIPSEEQKKDSETNWKNVLAELAKRIN